MSFLKSFGEKVAATAVAAKDKVAVTVGAKEKSAPAWSETRTYLRQALGDAAPHAIENSILERPLEVVDDMTKPLSHYYTSCSHNTYCPSRQLGASVSLEAYKHCLAMGARQIELDVHDGGSSGPVVFHGLDVKGKSLNVMAGGTRKLNTSDIFELVAAHAFTLSEFPLIIALELHCNEESQAKLAEQLVAAFGSRLVQGGMGSGWFNNGLPPSPADLKGKVLVNVGTGIKAAALIALVCLKCYGDYDHPIVLRNLTESQRVDGFDRATFAASNTTKFCRVFPDGSMDRLFNSSNPHPIGPWTAGVQFVALNFQDQGLPMYVHQGLFRGNGFSGFVLKPDSLTGQQPAGAPPVKLTMRIVAFTSGGAVKPSRPISVEVRMDSVSDHSSSFATPESQTDDSGKCTWGEGANGRLTYLSTMVAVLTFVVRKNGKERWQFALPACRAAAGEARVVPLLDISGGETGCSLTVDIVRE